MKTFLAIAILALLSSCCKKPMQTIDRSDSVRIETVTKYVEVLRDTTIYVRVPVESREVIRRDSSRLTTSVAVSEARINMDGSLYHSLENKPVNLSTVAQIKDTVRDTVYVEESTSSTHETQVIEKRFIPVFFWICFAFTLAVVLAGIAWVVVKVKRVI